MVGENLPYFKVLLELRFKGVRLELRTMNAISKQQITFLECNYAFPGNVGNT